MKRVIIISLVIVLVTASGIAGWSHFKEHNCISHADGKSECVLPGGKSDLANVIIVPNPQAKVGDVTNCIVSGEEFTINEEYNSVTYNGQRYYTCCSQCSKQFNKNPEKYLKSI